MEGDNICNTSQLFKIHFNPLPPHGGRLAAIYLPGEGVNISIHSLRMEGDSVFFQFFFCFSISIHSLRMEGDIRPLTPTALQSISIHSLRMEGDLA